MLKKIIWLCIFAGLLVVILPKVFYQLSVWFDSSNGEIQRVVLEDDTGLLLPPDLDTLPVATNSATIDIAGFSQNAEEVELYINDIAKDKIPVTKADGSFTLKRVRLYEGENIFSLVSYDKTGKKSAFSEPVTVTYKKDAPKLIVQEPADNAKKTGNDMSLTIVGLTDSDAEVTINGKWVRLGSDGTFSHKVPVSEGENKFTITATDEAGNTTEIQRTVTYSK